MLSSKRPFISRGNNSTACARRVGLSRRGGSSCRVVANAREAAEDSSRGAVTDTLSTPKTLRVRYLRKDKNYAGWWLHCWGDVTYPTDWAAPLPPSGWEAQGPFWDLPLDSSRSDNPQVGLQIHKGDDKAAGAEVAARGFPEVWLVNNVSQAFDTEPQLAMFPAGDLTKSYAHWVDRSTLLWRMPVSEDGKMSSPLRQFQLHYSRTAGLHVGAQGVEGGDESVPLEVVGPGIASEAVQQQYPYLTGCTTLRVPAEHLDKVSEFMYGQVAVSVHSALGEELDSTGVQMEGLLEDLFYTDEALGDHWDESTGCYTISVWAPTAQQVELLHYQELRGGEGEVLPMTRNSKGVWQYNRPREWEGTCYKFRVTAFCPWTCHVETMEVTDPYSRCTTANGERSILVGDVDKQELVPEGWQGHASPALEQWTDISLYELHIRDFSISDPSVPPHLRGKYRAFCPQYISPPTSPSTIPQQQQQQQQQLSHGLQHLVELRSAGLNHIHLLPTYDYGSVPEREEEQEVLQVDLSPFPADSEQQQAAVLKIADADGFNWGYDPVHYGVPEGGYSCQPDGTRRILEFREMVQSLHSLGYRVVLDVVYNHTFASGPYNRYSVLDKVVPGYYHRRGEGGDLLHSTCCNNTASEHKMFERLMIDDLTHWARDYKVDGFRFDIMGHHMVSNMINIRTALDKLTLEKDGVDGPKIYLYGEAWDFGEMVNNARGVNACQMNIGGLKIGGFNDRMRDGAMGGSPYQPPNSQGFVTGLVTDPNGARHQGSPEQQLDMLLHGTDWIRFALAGNLRQYRTQIKDGRVVAGEEDTYHGNQALAYCMDPCENIPFNGCHDNETIFDQVMMKAASHVSAAGRARMCSLAHALLLLSQGVPFIHAGDDLLRSKSLDRDSYNSGDWFNRIDWTGQDNNFGVGLPVATKNNATWPLKKPLLTAAADYKPTPDIIKQASDYFKALLQIRYSSPLFRLARSDHIQQQLIFHNTGPGQTPGLLVMQLNSAAAKPAVDGTHDPNWRSMLVVFNARPEPVEVAYPEGLGRLELHPALQGLAGDEDVQGCGGDDERRVVVVQPRLAAVFVSPW